MKALTAADIKAINDRTVKPVSVPEWGGQVWVRNLSVRERENLESSVIPGADGKVQTRGFRVLVVIASTVTEPDEDGNYERMFADADARWLSDKAASAVEKIAEAALEHNGMTEDASKDAEGKSGDGPASASFAGSPSGSGSPWPTSEMDSAPES